jgi:hypothetical protein
VFITTNHSRYVVTVLANAYVLGLLKDRRKSPPFCSSFFPIVSGRGQSMEDTKQIKGQAGKVARGGLVLLVLPFACLPIPAHTVPLPSTFFSLYGTSAWTLPPHLDHPKQASSFALSHLGTAARCQLSLSLWSLDR